MLTAGEMLSLAVEKPAVGGRMIARADGQVVLVSGAIPGERVTARVERTGRGVAYAETVTVDEASSDRRAVDGNPLCGGCLYAYIDYQRQVVIKGLVIEDAFTRIARMPLSRPAQVMGSPEEGYRMRARLHVRDGQAGFFLEGSHVLCDARQTRQLLPAACDAIDRLLAGLRSLGMAAGGELDVSENVDGSQRAVHLDAAAPLDVRALRGLSTSEGLTGLAVSSGARGAGPVVIAGDPHVTDRLTLDGETFTLRRHVLSFFQGNRYLLAPLVAHVLGVIGRGDRVIDLYAGTGLFSVAAAVARQAEVIAVEGDRAGAADLAVNARVSGGSIETVHEPVEAFVARSNRPPAVLIVDPPRTGMSRQALQGAIGLGAATVAYVSCDVATLARDARRFHESGYTLETVLGFDLFPNTPHVETVAIFRRL